MFLFKYIGTSGFTINQHYLIHIPEIIRSLGPLRNFSARPLERTIGQLKKRINSQSMPSENIFNVIQDRSRDSREKWHEENDRGCTVRKDKEIINMPLARFQLEFDEVPVLDLLYAFFTQKKMVVNTTSQTIITKVQQYPIHNSTQALRFTRGAQKPLLAVAEIDSDEYSTINIQSIFTKHGKFYFLCEILGMFNLENIDLGLVKIMTPIILDRPKGLYYINKDTVNSYWKVIELSLISSYAVMIESLATESKSYINWQKKY
jgi:hypothetical protein